jgi:outer membrane lipoprotein-sorting protein
MRRILLAIAFALISVSVIAQETPDPAEILRRAALFGQFTSLEVNLTMEIHERRGTKDRGLVAYVKRDGDNAQALVQIVSPGFLNSMKFLSTTDGEDTSQWLATSRGVRRVAANSRNDQLFDSDFTVEDLSDYDPDDFDLTITGSRLINGSECYVLEAVPRDIETDYAKRVMCIDKSTGLLVLAEFLDDAGEVVRRFELLEHMDLEGVAFPKVARMTTVAGNTYTILTVDDAQIGHDIPDRVFNRGNL